MTCPDSKGLIWFRRLLWIVPPISLPMSALLCIALPHIFPILSPFQGYTLLAVPITWVLMSFICGFLKSLCDNPSSSERSPVHIQHGLLFILSQIPFGIAFYIALFAAMVFIVSLMQVIKHLISGS